jgi:putative ABC transport system permease protein
MSLSPRWNKILSDTWGHKLRSLLIVASITIGLFAVGLIVGMQIILNHDMAASYEAVDPANIQLIVSPFDQGLLDTVSSLSGVRQAEGAAELSLRYRTADGTWEPLNVLARPDLASQDINRVAVVHGFWPPRDKELVVDQYKAGDLPVGVGGSLEVELPSGTIRQMDLTGIVHDLTIGSGSGGNFFIAPVQGYVTLDSLPWLEYPEKMNRLYVTVDGDAHDKAHIQAVADQVVKKVEDSGAVVSSVAVRASNDHPNRVYIQAISAVLVVLGFLVMFLSGFLITNTLAAVLNQQVNQIGIMKTIGARRGQIIRLYTWMIFIYGVVAFLIALPLSAWGAYAVTRTFASAVNFQLLGFRVEPPVVVLELLLALILPQLAGIVPILNGTRISVVEALSGVSQTHPRLRKSWLDRRIEGLRGLPRPTLLSVRNTFRRKGRLALTLVTLTLGGAIFIGTFNTKAALTDYIDHIGRYFMADVNLTLKQPARLDEVEQLVRSVPGVKAVEGWGAASAVLIREDGSNGESVGLLAPPVDSPLVNPVLLEGRWLQPGDGAAIVVNERFRETYPDLKVGDTIKLDIGGSKKALEVVGFFQLSGRSGGYLAYTPYDYLASVLHQTNQASTFRITADQPGLTLAEQKALGRAIETRLTGAGFEVAQVQAGRNLTATTASGLDILTGFLVLMATLIAVVGSIGLAGTMSLNVLERTREIGIIRAIGASDRSVTGLVMVEGVLIGLMSWILGVLVSFPISSAMSNAINLSLFGAAASFVIAPTGYILWLVIVLVLSALASVFPARNATRLTIREVLSYE